MNSFRPTWVEISKGAFSRNVARLKKRVGSKVDVLAVLKADAYGHGARALAPLAIKSGASSIGVSSLEEALVLRQEGILAPILILGGIYPFQNFSIAVQSDLLPTVASFSSARFLARLAQKTKRIIPFHLKVDTGMGRIGVSPQEARKILKWLMSNKMISLEGLYSHFSSADSSASFTRRQLKIFSDLKRDAYRWGYQDIQFHMANSAGALRYKNSHHELVRPGLILYGISPFRDDERASFSPVLNWQTRVIFLKRVPKGTPVSYGRTFTTKKSSLIATLPVGYADGIPRLSSNRGSVLIHGKRCPIVGRVTMDHIMIDVTGKSVTIGDKAILIGKQGREQNSAQDWADWSQTNAYEIVCGISKRVPRVYVK